jgi:hypothetical protein
VKCVLDLPESLLLRLEDEAARIGATVYGLIERRLLDSLREKPHLGAASALGKLGGQKGGIARAAALGSEERHRIALLGARARMKRRLREIDVELKQAPVPVEAARKEDP